MSAEPSPGELLERFEQLTARVDELDDPRARALAQELLASILTAKP